ncbi:MAG TPA: hypothetical protein VFT64_02010 [Rickettsiales bacterium]|nr:hypothetical protein [Rickettsiales bacterium]
MRALDIKETQSGIILHPRVLPAALKVLYFLSLSVFVVYCVLKIGPQILHDKESYSHGHWLLPVYDTSEYVTAAICIVIGLAICVISSFRGILVLLLGENWEINTSRHIVFKNGKEICNFSDIAELVIEGNFWGERPPKFITLYFLTKDNRKLHIVEGLQNEAQLQCFLEAGKVILRRTRIPYRKIVNASLGLKPTVPTWWENAL